MTNHIGANVECRLVGDYVDEADSPAGLPLLEGEVVRPKLVGSYVDMWGSDDDLKEFIVLLKDGRSVAVRGHGLKHSPHAVAGQDVYSVLVRNGGEEVLVALFKSAEVAGIFHGELWADRKIA